MVTIKKIEQSTNIKNSNNLPSYTPTGRVESKEIEIENFLTNGVEANAQVVAQKVTPTIAMRLLAGGDISIEELATINPNDYSELIKGIIVGKVTINGVRLNDLTKLANCLNKNIDISTAKYDDINRALDIDKLHELDNDLAIALLNNLSQEDLETLIETLKECDVNGNATQIIKGLELYDRYRSNSQLTNDVDEIIGGSIPNSDVTLSYMTPLRRMEAIAFAYSQIGVSYNFDEYGGGGWWINDIPYPNPYSDIEGSSNYNPEQASKNPALTCNGLTYWAYKEAGVDIFQGSSNQMRKSPIITAELINGELRGTLTPGDIIAFDDNDEPRAGTQTGFPHVAIYVGDGKMIESTTRIDPTTRDNIDAVTLANVSDYEKYSYTISW